MGKIYQYQPARTHEKRPGIMRKMDIFHSIPIPYTIIVVVLRLTDYVQMSHKTPYYDRCKLQIRLHLW